MTYFSDSKPIQDVLQNSKTPTIKPLEIIDTKKKNLFVYRQRCTNRVVDFTSKKKFLIMKSRKINV